MQETAWIRNYEGVKKELEPLFCKGMFEYCGTTDVPYAVFDSVGELLIANHVFHEIFIEEGDPLPQIKREIYMIKAMNKERGRFLHCFNREERLRQFEVVLFAFINEDEPLYICSATDLSDYYENENLILEMNYQLTQKVREINDAQVKIMSQEKLVGIGQLAAGVAHEINNPLGFVKSNFKIFDEYFRQMTQLLIEMKKEAAHYKKEQVEPTEKERLFFQKIDKLVEDSDYEFILSDYEGLYKDTTTGLERVERIVTSLRKFSRVDQQLELAEFNLNEGIEETLTIASNEIKYDAEVIKDMQYIPLTYAIGGEINQVLLNILINAVHAIKEKGKNQRGIIKITTRSDDKYIYCEIMDNGIGIKESDRDKVFIPFFTTKEVGKGTGLGMSIAYDIITNKHGGELTFISEYGMGTTFKIKLPICKVESCVARDFINL